MPQLRVFFTMLCGTLAATAALCADLNDPFRGAPRFTHAKATYLITYARAGAGSFRITPSSEQLIPIRALMDMELCEPSARYASPGAEVSSPSVSPSAEPSAERQAEHAETSAAQPSAVPSAWRRAER